MSGRWQLVLSPNTLYLRNSPPLLFRTLSTELASAPSSYALPEQAPVAWFVMQRAVDAFRELHGRFPIASETSMSQVRIP